MVVADDFARVEEARIALGQVIEQAGLSPLEAEILDLHLEGLTGPEIAARLGRADGTVKSALFRARKKLRRATA